MAPHHHLPPSNPEGLSTAAQQKAIDDTAYDAAELADAEREEFLKDRFRNNPQLESAVRHKLAQIDSFRLELEGAGTSLLQLPEFRCEEKIGKYSIKEKLGSGAMGDVYLAYDENLKRLVAIKFLKRLADGERWQLREGRALSKIDSSRVVRVHEEGVYGNIPYLVLQYIPGQSLGEALASGYAASPIRKLQIACHIAEGLLDIHRAGVAHGDLKPDNILLPDTGGAVILDLGLARIVESATKSMGRSGTSLYMAPEQFGNDTADLDFFKCDVYALGVVIWVLMQGAEPSYQGEHRTPLKSLWRASQMARRCHRAILEATKVSAAERTGDVNQILRLLRRRMMGWPEAITAGLVIATAAGTVWTNSTLKNSPPPELVEPATVNTPQVRTRVAPPNSSTKVASEEQAPSRSTAESEESKHPRTFQAPSQKNANARQPQLEMPPPPVIDAQVGSSFDPTTLIAPFPRAAPVASAPRDLQDWRAVRADARKAALDTQWNRSEAEALRRELTVFSESHRQSELRPQAERNLHALTIRIVLDEYQTAYRTFDSRALRKLMTADYFREFGRWASDVKNVSIFVLSDFTQVDFSPARPEYQMAILSATLTLAETYHQARPSRSRIRRVTIKLIHNEGGNWRVASVD